MKQRVTKTMVTLFSIIIVLCLFTVNNASAGLVAISGRIVTIVGETGCISGGSGCVIIVHVPDPPGPIYCLVQVVTDSTTETYVGTDLYKRSTKGDVINAYDNSVITQPVTTVYLSHTGRNIISEVMVIEATAVRLTVQN